MAQYRVKEKSFVNNAIREPGETVEVDFGQDGDGKDITYNKKLHANLEPIGAPKTRGKAKDADADAGTADAPADAGSDLA